MSKVLIIREEAAMQPSLSEEPEVSEVFDILTASTDIGKEKAMSLMGQMLDERHYTLILDRPGVVVTPDGQVLCILLKQRLSPQFLETIRPIASKVASHPVAVRNRVAAAGAERAKRKRKDGPVSKMRARSIRGGQVYPSRLTAYKASPEEFSLMAAFADQVAEALRHSYVHDGWEEQFKKASQIPPVFLMKTEDGREPFRKISCNKNWRTAAHVDVGDTKEGFGAMCCLGDFEGCDLVFPRYKVAVRYREGDVLLANVVNEVHGNTPLLNPEGKVPTPDSQPDRLACVINYLKKS